MEIDNNFVKVAFVVGKFENKLYNELEDWDDIYALIEKIVYNWSNFINIQNEDEKGYIMAYAKRVIGEMIR